MSLRLRTQLQLAMLVLVVAAGASVVYVVTHPKDTVWAELVVIADDWAATGPVALVWTMGGPLDDDTTERTWRRKERVKIGTRIAVTAAAARGVGVRCEAKVRDLKMSPPRGEPPVRDAREAHCETIAT